MRKLVDLIQTTEPAWPLVQQWVAEASNATKVHSVTADAGGRALERLQVTLRSPMGAIVYHTGGLSIDGGWLRILGAGCPDLPRALPDWSIARMPMTDALFVADDVIGGFFAVNGGALPGDRGAVCHFAPDTLRWANFGLGYSDFVRWALGGDLEAFYDGLRWPGWRDDVALLRGDQAFSIYPPLWAEPGNAITNRSRRAVPVAEIYAVQIDFARRL